MNRRNLERSHYLTNPIILTSLAVHHLDRVSLRNLPLGDLQRDRGPHNGRLRPNSPSCPNIGGNQILQTPWPLHVGHRITGGRQMPVTRALRTPIGLSHRTYLMKSLQAEAMARRTRHASTLAGLP